MKIVALFLIKVLKPFCLVIFFLSCSFSRPSWSLKASRLLYFLHINMSPSSATAGCQLNAALGLRKHHHCLLTDSLSPFTHTSDYKKNKKVWKFEPPVISSVIMNLFLGPFRCILALPRSALVTWGREKTPNHSMLLGCVRGGRVCVCVWGVRESFSSLWKQRGLSGKPNKYVTTLKGKCVGKGIPKINKSVNSIIYVT